MTIGKEREYYMEQQEFRSRFSSYESMSQMLKTYSYKEILETSAGFLDIQPEVLEQYPMGGYSKGMQSGAYRFVLEDLIQNVDHYDQLYTHLEDDLSKSVFSNLIGYRILPLPSFLEAAYDAKNPQYFDKEIITCDKDEVFVDCGGFTGDTAEGFIRQFTHYKKIYVYEPSPENAKICRRNLERYPNITVRQCGVGEKNSHLSIQGNGASGTFMAGRSDGDDIEIISLDEDIREKVSFIKMDIEGAEIPALLGAKRRIRKDHPKLAICTYHIVSDMWEIPRLIDEIHPGYRFYIRHYHLTNNWETVIYAIPPKKKERTPKKGEKRIVALSVDEGWTNVQLVKECGTIPYLLYKNHSCVARMAGGRRNGGYPNQRYIEGVQMEFLQDGGERAKIEYLRNNSQDIDCLLLRGPYPAYYLLADIYKAYNPIGKICLSLDANSGWMDRLQWTDPRFVRFMDQCDIICTSGRTMQTHLNEKWPWAIEYIPNGFYDHSDHKLSYRSDKKENIILTVGRLGTQQKATNVLLEAFAQIAEKIPDWRLHLAGSVARGFEGYLTQFWTEHPELKERIRFLGNIGDRETLYDEYERAKIFALPSVLEGGTPNVIAEALYAGDAIAITKIDEYRDATDQGRCGLAADIGDISGFADILLRLCQDEDLEAMCHRSHAYAKENFDMERIVARLYYMMFGEEG